MTQAGGMPAPTTASTPNGVTPKWRSLVCALRWSQTVIPPCGSRDSPSAVAVNKRYDFTRMEREFITTDISLRGLCRKHGISAHSLVTVQAKKGKWAEKREQYQAKESDAFMSRHAARQADRLAEIEDKFLDVIEEALDKFASDMHATERKRIDGEWVEVPVMRLKPKDVAILLDRLQVLFDKPTRISEGRDLTVRSELPIDALNQIVELTRGRAAPPTSPLPRRRPDD